MNSTKSLGVHELVSQNPHQIVILFNKHLSESPQHLECRCCLNYIPGFLVFMMSLYILMENFKNGNDKMISITAYIHYPVTKYDRA